MNNKYIYAVMLVCLIAVFPIKSVEVNAKNYYDNQFNASFYKNVPYERVDEEEKECNSNSISCIWITEDTKVKRVSKLADFNLDGKKEKVEFSLNELKKGNQVIFNIKINGKIAEKNKVKNSDWLFSCFSTFRLNDKIIAVLYYGDNNLSGGGAVVYEWTKSGVLKKIMTYKTKGYLQIYKAKSSKMKQDLFFIEDRQQLSNHFGEKWPANVMKHYKKYARSKANTVTKTSYAGYRFVKNKLKLLSKDNYYIVGNGYD